MARIHCPPKLTDYPTSTHPRCPNRTPRKSRGPPNQDQTSRAPMDQNRTNRARNDRPPTHRARKNQSHPNQTNQGHPRPGHLRPVRSGRNQVLAQFPCSLLRGHPPALRAGSRRACSRWARGGYRQSWAWWVTGSYRAVRSPSPPPGQTPNPPRRGRPQPRSTSSGCGCAPLANLVGGAGPENQRPWQMTPPPIPGQTPQ